MMKTLVILMGTASVMCAPALAQAVDAAGTDSGLDFFAGVGFSAVDGDGATLTAPTVRGSVFFNEYLGVEAEYSFGSADEFLGSTGSSSLSIDSFIALEAQYALFAVGRIPLTDDLSVLGRIGYGATELSATFKASSADPLLNGSYSDTEKVDGYSVGVAAQYMVTDRFGLRGDYTRFEATEESFDGGLDVYSIGGVVQF